MVGGRIKHMFFTIIHYERDELQQHGCPPSLVSNQSSRTRGGPLHDLTSDAGTKVLIKAVNGAMRRSRRFLPERICRGPVCVSLSDGLLNATRAR